MGRPIKSNELAIQSYIFTTAKYDFNAYEKRIMYRLVELAQDELKGIMIRDNMHKIEPTLFGREITMPVADILRNEKDQNYTIAKKAFRSLAQKGVEYEDDKFWQYTQKRPLEFTFEDLKQRFGVKDKYKLVGHFKTRVLDIAKKELDESSPYSFNYIEIKEGRKVVAFKFFPTFHPDKQDPELYEREKRSKLTARAQISREALDYLRYSFEFKAAEINKNKKTIIEGEQKIPDFIGFLSSLVGPSRTAKNRIGYVINAIKKKTAET